MEIKASAKFVRGSPRKVRLVAKTVIGLTPAEAIARLSLIRKKVSGTILKVIKQAMANAKNNFDLDPETLRIAEIRVGDGPRAKRLDKSHGARFDSGIIKKRFFHLWVTLKSVEDVRSKRPKIEKPPKEDRKQSAKKVNQGALVKSEPVEGDK
jgi:large subunit ribosomal protein L22